MINPEKRAETLEVRNRIKKKNLKPHQTHLWKSQKSCNYPHECMQMQIMTQFSNNIE
jgi:hypothetical protein